MESKKQDVVVREFPAIGKYRIRLITKDGKNPFLDIREYVNSPDGKFEGFTRRGVRFLSHSEALELKTILADVTEGGYLNGQ